MHAQSISLQKNDRIFLYTHSDILHFGAGGEGQDKTEMYPLYFFPMGIFCFTTNFGRLYSSVWALLEERSGTIRSVLTGIDFSTEGSQCLDFILLQLFPLVWQLLWLLCNMVCTGVLKQKVT